MLFGRVSNIIKSVFGFEFLIGFVNCVKVLFLFVSIVIEIKLVIDYIYIVC